MGQGYAGLPSGEGYPPPMVGGWVLLSLESPAWSGSGTVYLPTFTGDGAFTSPAAVFSGSGALTPRAVAALDRQRVQVRIAERARLALLARLGR